MAIKVTRPAVTQLPAGSLGCELFQTAYVVHDLDAAKATFARDYGVSEFLDVPMPPLPEGMSSRISLAWAGGQQIELIEAKGPGQEIYTDWMEEGRNIKHHHFGYLVANDAQWEALQARLKEEGRPTIFGGDGGICQFIYVEAPELGHYLEYVYPNEQGKALFEAVPGN